MSEQPENTNWLSAKFYSLQQLFQGRGWTITVSSVAVILVGALCYFAWSVVGPSLTTDPAFLLTLEKLEVPPPPEWIHADVKSEVFEKAQLNELSVLDPKATVKVYNAFAVHGWVAKVNRVTKQAGPKMIVELEYRQPVAMVEVYDHDKWGLLPIDGRGVVLSPNDFSRNQAGSFLRVAVDGAMPLGDVGSNWGDSRVVGGARIAEAWGEHWKGLQLYRISATAETAGGPPVYEISTRDNSRILWGNAPGQEGANENTPQQKIEMILAEVNRTGPLTGRTPPVIIDVRRGDARVFSSAAAAPQGASSR